MDEQREERGGPKMMSWRFCLTHDINSQTGESEFTIRELYTSERGELGWTQDPVAAWGETPEEVRDDLEKMLADIRHPVLDLSLNPPRLVERKDLIDRLVKKQQTPQSAGKNE